MNCFLRNAFSFYSSSCLANTELGIIVPLAYSGILNSLILYSLPLVTLYHPKGAKSTKPKGGDTNANRNKN